MTNQEIYQNRLKWIKFLLKPDTKKFKGVLEDINNPDYRCCLGHACHVFNLEKTIINAESFGKQILYENFVAVLPYSLVEKLHMWGDSGEAKNFDNKGTLKDLDVYSLVTLNDSTDYTPQQIGEYLMKVIMGGDGTPFKPIKKDWN